MIDYCKQASIYRPEIISLLLIGEAPPPSAQSYFYVPQAMNPTRPIKDYTTLPATIFNHYFQNMPRSKEKYKYFLNQLKNRGIFLIDITDKPIKIRDKNYQGSINQPNLNYLKSQIPKLKEKIKSLKIEIDESEIIFLLARNNYRSAIKEEFPYSRLIRWKDFRLTTEKS